MSIKVDNLAGTEKAGAAAASQRPGIQFVESHATPRDHGAIPRFGRGDLYRAFGTKGGERFQHVLFGTGNGKVFRLCQRAERDGEGARELSGQ